MTRGVRRLLHRSAGSNLLLLRRRGFSLLLSLLLHNLSNLAKFILRCIHQRRTKKSSTARHKSEAKIDSIFLLVQRLGHVEDSCDLRSATIAGDVLLFGNEG